MESESPGYGRYAGAIVGGALTLVAPQIYPPWTTLGPNYATVTFCLAPFLAGVIIGFILARKREVQWQALALSCFASMACAGALLQTFRIEGVICEIMATPVMFPFMFGGAWLGKSIANRTGSGRIGLAIALPAVFVSHELDAIIPMETTREMRTTVIVDAPPAKVWPFLHHLDVSTSDDWLFKAGVAHPVRIRTEAVRVGAFRTCILSTGDMPETITAVEPNERLAFHVLATPDSMKELNPFGEVKAAHLKGYFESLDGSFTLEPLSDGRTKLTGWSRYRHRYRPAIYWSVWTDAIVKKVHVRVLDEIKRRAESR